MKKKVKLILLIIIGSIFCVGCMNAGTTRAIRHSGFSLSNSEFECPALYPSDTGYDKIKFLTNTYAITTAGTIYQLSIGMPYSNNLNCKEASFSHKVVSVFDGKVMKADDGKLYYLISSNDNEAFSEVTSEDSNYQLYKTILSVEGVVKVITANQSNESYYALMKDGSVYNYVVTRDGNNISLASASIVYSKANFGGEIIDFNYAGDSTATFIRTSDAIFRMLITNKDLCSKYADVACKYEMQVDEGLTEHRDEILGFSGTFLITTYGKEFNASST